VVCAFVDQAAHHGGLARGVREAGVGKTALLETAAAYAASSGLRLLRATGAQFEANVSFAALHQLLFPLLDSDLSLLGAEHRAALRGAFGFRGRAVPDRLQLSHAALELLARSGTTTAIMVVVDDLPWLDQASAWCWHSSPAGPPGPGSGSWRPRALARRASSTVPAYRRMSFGHCRTPRRSPAR